MIFDEFSPSRTRRTLTAGGRTLRALGLDGPLTGVLAIIVCFGILVVYSASGQNPKMVEHHLGNIAIAVTAMVAETSIRPMRSEKMLVAVGMSTILADSSVTSKGRFNVQIPSGTRLSKLQQNCCFVSHRA